LTTWFRDYLFIPLLRYFPINNITKILNIFILFIVIGLWHGPSWNFVLWGVFLALFYLPSIYFKKQKQTKIIAEGKLLPSLYELYKMISTFIKFSLAMIFFRSESLSQIWVFFKKIFSFSLIEIPKFSNNTLTLKVLILIIVFIFVEWIGREQQYALEKIGLDWKKSYRITFYYLIVFLIFWFAGQKQEFIYFQF
jgi:D-alanyl-lipoteichoic acid acyltransferase DltB (MBOAT superfamily)